MILVTGGLGFIGSHVARALLDAGESVVVTRFRSTRVAAFLDGEVTVEAVDLTDAEALHRIGERHEITGIVHLAGTSPGSVPIAQELKANTVATLNVLDVAQRWNVRRVGVASTIGVYFGVQDAPWREVRPRSPSGTHASEAAKKCAEILGGAVAHASGLEVVNLRIGGIWGPLGRPSSRFIALPGLVHAAVNAGEPPAAYADDAVDLCYVKDCARAIALLQTAPSLKHRTYNIGTGVATSNRRVVAAIRAAVPGAQPAQHDDNTNPPKKQNNTRQRNDTSNKPTNTKDGAVADYVSWLRAGNER